MIPLPRSPFYFLFFARIIHRAPAAFEKLVVQQKAVTFTDARCSVTKELPRGYFFPADRLNRATVSIAGNHAERNGGFTAPDFKRLFTTTRGGVRACVPFAAPVSD